MRVALFRIPMGGNPLTLKGKGAGIAMFREDERQVPSDKLDINRPLQILLAVGGAATLCTYYGSWHSTIRLAYDIPSTFIMCAFMAQIVCEGLRRQFTVFWWTRVILMVPLSVIPVGRELIGWAISGHVTNMLAVGLIQTTDRRLSVVERIIYWIPFPIVFLMHWFVFDEDGHWDTYNALVAGTVLFVCRLCVPMFRTRAAGTDARPAG